MPRNRDLRFAVCGLGTCVILEGGQRPIGSSEVKRYEEKLEIRGI